MHLEKVCASRDRLNQPVTNTHRQKSLAFPLMAEYFVLLSNDSKIIIIITFSRWVAKYIYTLWETVTKDAHSSGEHFPVRTKRKYKSCKARL